MSAIECDVCIVGAGSGGIGAAVAAAEFGACVVVVDKNRIVGGTVTMSWVSAWEASCGNAPLARRLWRRMRSYPNGAPDQEFSVYSRGEDMVKLPNMPFEPWAYERAVMEEFSAFPRLRFYGGTTFVAVRRDGRRISQVLCLGQGGEKLEISAKVFIDASGDIALCRDAGCAYSLGADSKAEYGEADAPDQADRNMLNEVNWLFRVASGIPGVKVEESPVPERLRKHAMAAIRLPCSDIIVNICGAGIFQPERAEDYATVPREQLRIAYDWYRWQVISGEHPDWRLIGFAPEMGIRETFRLKARYVLTQNDIRLGYHRQSQRNFIGAADHRLDVHGTNLGRHPEYAHPVYGIPYECIQALEYDNLLAACRGFGVSHIAAGSCRLARVILNIGCAAGRAAALSAASGIMLENIDVARIADFEEPTVFPTRISQCDAAYDLDKP